MQYLLLFLNISDMALAFEYKLLKWGYGDNNGPKTWSEWYPVAKNGKRQSPIDLSSSIVKEDLSLPPIRATFQPCSQLRFENTGNSWQLHFHNPDVSSLTGGPLHGEYKVKLSNFIHFSEENSDIDNNLMKSPKMQGT